MIKITEKRTFQIPPCRFDKELVRKITILLQNFRPHYSLTSPAKDIESDDATLFVGTEWPSDISTINISMRGSYQSIDISINPGKGVESKVLVCGTNAVWVNGMADQLYLIFKNRRVSYYPFVEHQSLRTILSIFVIFLALWISNRRLWPLISEVVKGFCEPSFFALLFLVSIWLVYPLYKFFTWLFPRFAFEGSLEGKIRKMLWAIVIFLVAWVITELALPWLIAL